MSSYTLHWTTSTQKKFYPNIGDILPKLDRPTIRDATGTDPKSRKVSGYRGSGGRAPSGVQGQRPGGEARAFSQSELPRWKPPIDMHGRYTYNTCTGGGGGGGEGRKKRGEKKSEGLKKSEFRQKSEKRHPCTIANFIFLLGGGAQGPPTLRLICLYGPTSLTCTCTIHFCISCAQMKYRVINFLCMATRWTLCHMRLPSGLKIGSMTVGLWDCGVQIMSQNLWFATNYIINILDIVFIVTGGNKKLCNRPSCLCIPGLHVF